MNSQASLQHWLNELTSEIVFWNTLFATQGREGGDPNIFKFRTNPNCPFQIPEDLETDDCKILDVGSGPYSRLGYIHKGKKLNLTLIDPLAFAYRKLEKKYNYHFAVSAQTGLVECLSLILSESDYDLVHMSNSLDHSFDPIEGLRQLLYVTRVGGKVILRHHNNVAEQANYEGLHQWNLTVHDGNFIVWNKKSNYIVEDLIKDYATVEYAAPCEETTLDSKWQYNKIVIRKKKDFKLEAAYAGDVLVALCEHIIQISMKEACMKEQNIFEKFNNLLKK